MLDLHALDYDHEIRGVNPRMHGDLAVAHLEGNERQRLFDDLADCRRRQMRLGFAEKCPQSLDDLPAPFGGECNRLIPFTQLVESDLVHRQKVAARLGKSRDGMEWLIYLMGNAGRDFAHRREPRHVGQLLLETMARLLGLLAFGDFFQTQQQTGLTIVLNERR